MILEQIKGNWCLVSNTTRRPIAFYSGEGKPDNDWINKQEARINNIRGDIHEGVMTTLFHGSYIKAAKHLKAVLDKEKAAGNRNIDRHHLAFEVAKLHRGVNHRKLEQMVETFDILANLGYNLLTEIVDVPGYKPVGIAEFFRFMSHPKIPKEDKDEVKRLSVAHANEPKVGHDQKIREMFDKHGISLSGVVKKKVDEEIKPDILPVSGAGQDGTDILVNNYRKATPGQFQKIKKLLNK